MFDILAVTLLIILALVLAVLEIFFLPGITIAGICSVLLRWNLLCLFGLRNKWGCNNIIHCSRHYYCCHHRIYAIPKFRQNVSAYRNKLGSTLPDNP